MTNRKQKQKNIEKYFGKVREVSGDQVTVSLWLNGYERNEEIVGEFPRRYFPSAQLHAGSIFNYELKTVRNGGYSEKVTVSMIPPRKISKSEFDKIWEETLREVPED